ncbi:MAG: hypothetical protein Q8L08_03905 [Candidatus Nanopelagicaceae bacterium]|nr:hypothetical protein [Candidatus Nanopelagicaceae bacterium]
MKKFIALTLAALAVLTMASAPATAKPTVTTSAIPGGIWCC